MRLQQASQLDSRLQVQVQAFSLLADYVNAGLVSQSGTAVRHPPPCWRLAAPELSNHWPHAELRAVSAAWLRVAGDVVRDKLLAQKRMHFLLQAQVQCMLGRRAVLAGELCSSARCSLSQPA